MADYGLLGGLAEGLRSGLGAYQQTRAQMDEKKRLEDEKRRQGLLDQAAFKEKGLMQTPEGSVDFSPEEARKRKIKELTEQSGVLKSGYTITNDPETGEPTLTPVPGFKDLDKEYKKAMIGKINASTVNEREKGKTEKEPKPTQYQASGFAKRLEQAEGVFKNLSDKGFDPTSTDVALKRHIPDILGSYKGADLQEQDQAERNFVNAVLRKESGAAISSSEFDSAAKQYFPRTGDSPEVLKQKEINRKLVYENLKAESGPAYKKSPGLLDIASQVGPAKPKKKQGLLESSAMAATAPTKPSAGAIIDVKGKKYRVGADGDTLEAL